MAGVMERGSSRQWADLLAIVTGVALIGISMYPNDPASSPSVAENPGGNMLPLRMAAGVMTIGAVFLAQRWRRRAMARGLLFLAAAVLVVGFVIFRDHGGWALATLALPALLLLVAVLGIGPMPEPDAESSTFPHR